MAAPKKPAAHKPAKASPAKKPAPKRAKPADKAKSSGGNAGLLVGAGIGSAALAAAVLFMTRKKKPEAKKD